MHKKPLLKRLELLLPRLSSFAAKHELSPQPPLKRDVPVFLHFTVHNRIVMLKVGTEAGGLERSPERKLVHGIGVLGPVMEVVRIDGEVLL
jgi:hypothetical protein